MLVLDFDGVVADAFEECAAVAWMGIHPGPAGLAAAETAERMPEAFVDRFRVVRPYCRTLGHFIVAHDPRAGSIADQKEFEARFSGIGAAAVEAFTATATAARARLREQDPARWAAMHTLYPGIADLVKGADRPIAIVTAKDEPSVRAILSANGLDHHVRTIAGECHDKAAEVRRLCAEAAIDPGEAVFVDDNLDNVLRVRETGARSMWARWGYGTPEQRSRAEALGVDAIDLEDLPEAAAAARA